MDINPNYSGAPYVDVNEEENPNEQQPNLMQRVQSASALYTHGTGPFSQFGAGYTERAAASSAAHGTVPNEQQFEPGYRERASYARGSNNYFSHALYQAGPSASSLMPPQAPHLPDYRRIFSVMPQFSQGADLGQLSHAIGINLSLYFTPIGNYTDSGRLFYQALGVQEQADLDNAIANRKNSLFNYYNPANPEHQDDRNT